MKRCPCCSGCYPDDLIYCPSCGGGNKVELATREEYTNRTGKGFETIKSKYIKEKRFINIRNDFDKMDSARKFREEKELKEAQQREDLNIPRCPICGSTDLKKLDALDRGFSVFMLGLGSNKIGKTYQCKNCKSTF